MAHIAYVRVSTAEQNEARQIEALADIFADGDHDQRVCFRHGQQRVPDLRAFFAALSALQQENVVCTPLQALIQQPCMLLVLRHNQRRPPVLDAGDRIRENLRVAVFAFDHQLI